MQYNIAYNYFSINIALQEVKEAVMREYLQRVYNSVLAHPDLATLGSGIPDLLVKQAQATVMMHRY